jgi:hypothetical protein
VWQKFDDHCHRCQHLSREVDIMNEQNNTTDQSQNHEESAYSLLIRSEEKSRNAFELIMYPCLILGPLVAIWQFAQQPVNIPAAGLKEPRHIVFEASAQTISAETGLTRCVEVAIQRSKDDRSHLWQDLSDNCHCCHYNPGEAACHEQRNKYAQRKRAASKSS